jgi:uncharacterized membrane protein
MKKSFKIIVIVLLSILALVLITALFVRKDYKVERSISINRPKQEVYDYVKFLKNQNEYSVWAKIDPNMKLDFRGTDATVGFVSAWDSPVKEAGKGEQEIVRIYEGEKIEYIIRFFKPMESTDNAYMSFKSENDSATNVTWAIYGNMKYPTNLSLLFMDMDAMLGKDLSGGLSNLKTILEK